jgi:hypothetical protein
MSNGTEQISYRKSLDILDRHGLIILVLYWVTEIVSWLSLGHWLRALPRKMSIFSFAFDATLGIVKAWWQDMIFLLTLILLTPLAVTMAWNSNPCLALLGTFFSGYFLFDAIIYHVRVLWFDDLQPGIPNSRRGVSSHRRILFVAIFSFIQSIFLFSSLYRGVSELPDRSYISLLQRSFSTATLLSLASPVTIVDVVQVSVSLFFLAIVIAVMASIAYSRPEFSAGD